MSMQEPSEYVELSSQAYSLFADTVAAANGRALEYWKSVWQIASKPYASNALESGLRENFDRANQIVGLTVGEVSTTGQRSAEFAEKLLAHTVKVQETYAKATRALLGTGISNLNFVKDNAERQIDDLAKRFDDVQSATSSPASYN